MDKLKEIVDLIEQANKIYNSTADWEIKYDLIFDLGIWQKIREAGFSFDYYDPDTSYEEDVQAYLSALNEFKEKLGNVLEV